MKFQCLLLLISISIGSQGGLFGQEKELLPYEDTAAYEVYSAVLPRHRAQGPGNLLIRNETLRNFGAYSDTDPNFGICLRPDPEWEEIMRPAISDYLRVNKTKWRLQPKIKTTEKPYQLISSENVLALIKEEGWEGFYKKYPDSGGFIDLSAVGFNADKTVAIVSMGGWCGGLCGEGEYYVLQKKDGKWIPLDWKGRKCGWVS